MGFFTRKSPFSIVAISLSFLLTGCASEVKPPSDITCTQDYKSTGYCKSILDYVDQASLDERVEARCTDLFQPDSRVEFARQHLDELNLIKDDARASSSWFSKYASKSEWEAIYSSQEEYVTEFLGDVYLAGANSFQFERSLIDFNQEAIRLNEVYFLDFLPVTETINKICTQQVSREAELEPVVSSWNSTLTTAWQNAKNIPWYPSGFKEGGSGLAYKFVDGSCSPGTSCFLINVVAQNGCPTGVSGVASSYDSAETLLGEHNAKSPKLIKGKTVRLEFKVNRDAERLDITSLKCN